MSSSRAVIRREAAARLGAIAQPDPLTAASGSTTSAVVSALIDSTESDQRYVGCWAYFLNGTNLGEVRRVQSYVPASGTLVFNRALGASVAASDTFELHDWLDPTVWNDCISRALRRCTREHRDQLTIVTSQTNYALSSLTALIRPSQVIALMERHGSTANQYTWYEVPRYRWAVEIDDDALTLNLLGGLSYNSADTSTTLWLDWIGPYADLTTDAATTTCDLDWLVMGAIKFAYEVYGREIDDAAGRTVQVDKKEALDEFRRLTRMHSPKRASALFLRWD